MGVQYFYFVSKKPFHIKESKVAARAKHQAMQYRTDSTSAYEPATTNAAKYVLPRRTGNEPCGSKNEVNS